MSSFKYWSNQEYLDGFLHLQRLVGQYRLIYLSCSIRFNSIQFNHIGRNYCVYGVSPGNPRMELNTKPMKSSSSIYRRQIYPTFLQFFSWLPLSLSLACPNWNAHYTLRNHNNKLTSWQIGKVVLIFMLLLLLLLSTGLLYLSTRKSIIIFRPTQQSGNWQVIVGVKVRQKKENKRLRRTTHLSVAFKY